LQFFADRQAAARELRRVTAAGGTLLAAVWRSAGEMPVYEILQRVAERELGPIHDQRYAFADAQALEDLLTAAGFRDVDVHEEAIVSRFTDGAEFVRMNAMALVGMSGAQLPEEGRERVLAAISDEGWRATREFQQGAALLCEMRSNVAVAR
jgi:hypothetical protein